MKECSVCSTCFADDLDYCPADGAVLKHSLRCNLVLDERYRLERRLGRGGMGVVFKASHVFLRSTHAVKVILPDLVGEDPMLVTRFRQEAVVAASIRHKNIVSVTDFGVAEGTMPFLVMEFLVGKSLWDLLLERGRLSAHASLEVMEAIGAGVGAAHRRGIVHRDLKPLNIFVQEGMPISEGLKILDFGLAKIKSTDLYGSLIQAKTTSLMGSPHYMAPEQWSEGEPDARADVYSIGIILYQMLAGNTPFTGSSMPKIMKGHLMSEPPAFASIGVRVSRHVEAVVRHALQKDPRHRTSSVEQLLAELRQAVSKEDSVSDPLMISLQPSERETAPLPHIFSEGLTREFGSAVSAEPLSVDDHVLIKAQQQIEDEADRLMRELEDAQRRAEDARKRVEEAARKRAEKEAERKRAEEAAARKRAEEEQALKRAQKEEQKRVDAEQARKRAEEEESQRLAAEEAQREAEQERARKLAAEEANRLSMEVAEARSRAEDARKRAEEEAKGRAQEEAARRDAEERAAKLAQELVEIQQRAEEARTRAEEQEIRRAEEDAERRRAEEESERKRAEEEVRRRQEEEIARQTAEAEAARLAAEVKEAQQRVEEARMRAEEEAQRRLEEEAARKRAEEEAIRLVHEVDEVKHRADEVRKRAEEEAIRLGREVDEAKQQADEVRKLAEESARKEAAKELERKLREEQQKRESAIAADELGDEITILRGGTPSPTADQRAAQQTARDAARETLPVVVDSYQRRSFIKWIVSVIVVVLLGFGSYAAYLLTRPAPAQPANPPVIRPDQVSIPAGTFVMGRDDGRPQEGPAHSVAVKAFSIDRTEVTNEEYAEFVRATNHAPPSYWLGTKPPAQQEKLPVVDVSYEDAQAFAEWRSKRDGVTYRVPTEEEWEYAARGVNGYLYPWGKIWLDDYANVKSESPKPVGSYPKGTSSWGTLDMVGNVMEWTSSRASIYPGNKEKKIDADKRDWIVVRGSSYMARDPLDMTTTMRQSLPASNKHPFVGFRLVRVDS